ncbi:cytochrome p450 [Botrytis cinerea]
MGCFHSILEDLPVLNLFIKFTIVLTTYYLLIAIYRIWFHPLARFPGPRICAITFLYEIGWDYFYEGTYVYRIEEMHDRYGAIVRVNPDELSIRDPEYYKTVYVASNTRSTSAYPAFAAGMGIQVQNLTSQLKEHLERNTIVRLDHALFAFAGDVMCRICFETQDSTFLSEPNFCPQWFALLHTITRSSPIIVNFPWIFRIVELIPASLITKLSLSGEMLMNWRTMSIDYIDRVKRRVAINKPTDLSGGCPPSTLFHDLLTSDLPASELTTDRLGAEAQVLLMAGTMSVARSMGHLVVHILLNVDIRQRLTEELSTIDSDGSQNIPSYQSLQQLPYLQACIKEGLRMSIASMHRLPRCSPDVALQYREWIIPPGTPVGMSTYLMHYDPDVYPEPKVFKPERWLGEINSKMLRNYVPFAKGSRDCLGTELAYAEISIVLAAIFGPHGLKLTLYETDNSDVDPYHAFVGSLPKLSSKGIRVTME